MVEMLKVYINVPLHAASKTYFETVYNSQSSLAMFKNML